MFLCITAVSGLYGASYNSRHCLNFYSTMVIVMLLAQCALLVGYFADKSWKQKLPHDDTGEAARVRCDFTLADKAQITIARNIILTTHILMFCR